MTKKNKTSPSEIKQSNLQQTIRYSDRNCSVGMTC